MKLSKYRFSFLIIFLFATVCAVVVEREIIRGKEGNDIFPYLLLLDNERFPLTQIKGISQIPVSKIDWTRLKAPTMEIWCKKNQVNKSITKFEVFVENSFEHATFSTESADLQFWNTILDKFGSTSTLYISAKDALGKGYAAVFSHPNSPRLFTEQFLQSNFFNSADLTISMSPLRKEKKFDTMPALEVRAYIAGEQIEPTYISNELAQVSFGQCLQFGTISNDTLFALIKNDNGDIRKLVFSKGERLPLRSFLDGHIEETTVYFSSGAPDAILRKVGILVISDKKNLLAAQPLFLLKNMGISLNTVLFENLKFKAANLDFVWGDIQLTLTKNKAGNYHAKKRIGKSIWEKSLPNKPNLLIGKNFHMDSLIFDMSIATEHKDTMNKVWIENVETEALKSMVNINLRDTVLASPNGKSKSTIRLEHIHNEEILDSKISLELEIFDDTPRKKEKKYQFYWGSIDTTLTQKNKANFYIDSVYISVSQMVELLTKEPVLTSSVEGVVGAFSFDMIHTRKGKLRQKVRAKSNLQDSNIFSESIKKFVLEDNIEIGDQVELSAFKGDDIKGKAAISLKIIINNKAAQAASIDDANMFLKWGDRLIKTTLLGEGNPKKKVKDQIIERSSLLEIVKKPAVLNRFGKTETIVSANWFINDKLEDKQSCTLDKNWRECFLTYLESASSGDFVSVFMRTSKGSGIVCQFYIDRIIGEDVISFGNSQFDSLLFKYSVQSYQKLDTPVYKYDFMWGETAVALELKGNPRVFGGTYDIRQDDLEDILEQKIFIRSSDGEVISIQHAYLIINRIRRAKGSKKWLTYDFDCDNLDCAFNVVEAKKVLKELKEEVYSVRIFVDQHDQSEEFVKVSFIDFVIKNESNAWVPKHRLSDYVDLNVYDFQFVYQEKEKTLIKLDKRNEKYKWIVDKYKDDPTVELIDMPGFKTTQRTVYTKYDWGNNKSIRTTEVLSKNYTNAYGLYDYHALKSKKIQLYWKGYAAQFSPQTYCKDDFICADDGLQLQIEDHAVPILRGDLVVLPESGPGYKFIFDDINSIEIITALKNIPPHTNMFFENLIVEDEAGEKRRLPLKFAFHLE